MLSHTVHTLVEQHCRTLLFCTTFKTGLIVLSQGMPHLAATYGSNVHVHRAGALPSISPKNMEPHVVLVADFSESSHVLHVTRQWRA